MTYILAFLAAAAGGVAGYFAAATIGVLLAQQFGMSNFEGAAGYFAAFVIGPVGGLIGLILGAWLVFRYKGGYRGFSAIAGRSAIIFAAIAAVAVGAVRLQLATSENFPSGPSPQLDFEIRLPPHAVIAGKQQLDFEMQAGSQRSGGFLRDPWQRRDGDRQVLVGFVPLYTRTAQRMLVFSRPGEPKLLFNIRLAATPATSDHYGAWQTVDFVDDMKADSQPRRPSAAEAYEIRYRVPKP
jgi:MFS family permease